jgi:hypothetical protein
MHDRALLLERDELADYLAEAIQRMGVAANRTG